MYYDLSVDIKGKCTLDNTFIRTIDVLLINADELIIKNMDIINQLPYVNKKFNIYISANDRLEINNSTIGDKTSNVEIASGNKLEVYNSEIVGKKVKCKANHAIFGKKSSITATEETELEIPDFYEINITAPTIISNGNTFSNLTKPMILKRVVDTVKLERLKLIQNLKELKAKVVTQNEEDLKKYQSNLNNQPIRKVLSK